MPAPRLERFGFRAMGSPCEIALYGSSRSALEGAVRSCAREIARLEAKFSRFRDDSLATRINRTAGDPRGVTVDDETAALLDFADTAHRESEGRFDPTSGVLRRVWDFKSGARPSREAIAEILALVGWSKLVWQRPKLVLPVAGMQLDFGGFVKEYAADRVAELARRKGIRAGIIDLGGDLAVVGPHPNGDPWLVGIRNPRRPSEAMARIAITRGGLATSGDYERCMIVDGVRYSHLLDPRTGESFRQGPACVSVKADHCLVAGVTATIAMLHTEGEDEAFLSRVGLPHLCVTQDGSIRGTAQLVPARRARHASTRPPPHAIGRSRPPSAQPGSVAGSRERSI